MFDSSNALGGFSDRIRDLGEKSTDTAVSPAGARSSMQVMPGTITDPGFGVRPAVNDGLPEINRVGRDYANALLTHYGDETLAAAAYNAGPGKVDNWLTTIGDPRKGDISATDWISKIPFKETRDYTARVTGGGSSSSQPMTGLLDKRLKSPDSSGLTSPVIDAMPDSSKALHLLRLLTPTTHKLVPVDYDPWAAGMPGSGK